MECSIDVSIFLWWLLDISRFYLLQDEYILCIHIYIYMHTPICIVVHMHIHIYYPYIYIYPCIISIFTATCTLIQWYDSFTTALCVAQILDWKKVTLQFSFPEIGAWPVITRWGSNVSSLGFVVDISIADGVTNYSGHLPVRFLRICWRWNRFIRKMFGSL
jgi:hypothetical protein